MCIMDVATSRPTEGKKKGGGGGGRGRRIGGVGEIEFVQDGKIGSGRDTPVV